MDTRTEELTFYRKQSALSAPGQHEALFAGLPADVGQLCEIVQSVLLHQFWILEEKNYGVTAAALKSAGRNLNDEINLRPVEAILDHLLALDDRPLTASRASPNRVVGNCRDYSLLLVSMLRHQGVPARVRSGVARYFYPDGVQLEDHFIVEFWNGGQERWQRADPQLDEVQRRVLGLTMDTTDLPPGQFLDAGESYEELKTGRVAAANIGIFDYRGWVYVQYKLLSDLACINSVEVLPWEEWGMCRRIGTEAFSPADAALLEKIAALLQALTTDSSAFLEARRLYEENEELRVPAGYEPFYFELPLFQEIAGQGS